MRRLDAVVLALLLFLHCSDARSEQGDGDSGGDHAVSVAFENFFTRFVIVTEECEFVLNLTFQYWCERNMNSLD